jgi:DeoR/GlpR family transcriptional regulator of sugar metabolism
MSSAHKQRGKVELNGRGQMRFSTHAETAERRRAILDKLAQNHVVQVSQIGKEYGISEVSVRRDLIYLERLGLLRRIRGGAVLIPGENAALSTGSERAMCHAAEKARIGQAAAALVSPGDRLIFDSGTTVLQVARSLSQELRTAGNLTVITNSMPIVRELGSCPGVHLILLGGVYLSQYEVTVGPQAVEQIRSLHADKLFLGADGLTFAKGVTTANVLEAEVNRATIAAAAEVIVVADSSKIGQIGLVTIAHLDGIHKLITDMAAPPDFVAALRERGVTVLQV